MPPVVAIVLAGPNAGKAQSYVLNDVTGNLRAGVQHSQQRPLLFAAVDGLGATRMEPFPYATCRKSVPNLPVQVLRGNYSPVEFSTVLLHTFLPRRIHLVAGFYWPS